jgi:DNA modification methylase
MKHKTAPTVKAKKTRIKKAKKAAPGVATTNKRTRKTREPSAGVKEGEGVYGRTSIDLVTLEAAAAATGKTSHNIRDYIQRGRIAKFNASGEKVTRALNGTLRVSLTEVKAFLALVDKREERHHHAGLHPELGFYDVPERERTKHVHRLHPYLGKFIPQLVEWFLRHHFQPGQWVLDPFMGSGTTLVQGNELGLASIGVDLSPFNCLIARVKTDRYDLGHARSDLLDIESRVQRFTNELNAVDDPTLALFPEERATDLAQKLIKDCTSAYLNTWFAPRALQEMLYYRSLIPEYRYQDLLRITLSRAVRSSRLIPHFDLATPRRPIPVGEMYWCRKHDRYCLPIDNCLEKIHAYSEDAARRLETFARLRSNEPAIVVQGDSRNVDLAPLMPDGAKLDGIFTSPPYVGQIDYHDQHTYAYELFGFPRYDQSEIGPKKRGKSLSAREAYVDGIAEAFKNSLRFLKSTAKIFIVANDRFNLYPEITARAGLRIREQFLRAVTKRTEQGDDPYQESIFLCVPS